MLGFLKTFFAAFIFSNGTLKLLMVGRRHYPGSQVMLRIDDEPALSAKEPGFAGGEATAILERFATNAQRIRIRYQEFPQKIIDGELSTKGFAAALAFMRSSSGLLPPSKPVQPEPPAGDGTMQAVALSDFPYDH